MWAARLWGCVGSETNFAKEMVRISALPNQNHFLRFFLDYKKTAEYVMVVAEK